MFDEDGKIRPSIRFGALAAHIWFAETGGPLESEPGGPVLGVADGRAYALLYNGILGDKSVSGGNVLTGPLLERLRAAVPDHDGPWTIYGEASRISAARLKEAAITFKQTPYDVRAR